MRGIFIEVRHQSGCPLSGASATAARNPRSCRCAATARARIKGEWRLTADLPKGWRAKELEDFEDQARDEKRALDEGRTIDRPQRMPTLAEWGESCIANIRAAIEADDDEAFSPATLASYETIHRRYIKPSRRRGGLGDLPLTSVTPGGVDKWQRELPLSRAYAKQVRFTLSGMMRAAVNDGLLTDNPARVSRQSYGRRKKATRDERPEKFLPAATAQLLLRRTRDTEIGLLVQLALTSGLREGELAGLRIEDLDLARARVNVRRQFSNGRERPPKYESYRTTFLWSRLAQTWASLDGGSGWLFLNPRTKRPYSYDVLNGLLNDTWQAVAPRPKGYSWHVLRHTFSTMLDQASVRPAVIDAVMGHSPGGVQFVYRHVDDSELDVIEPVMESAYAACFADVPVSDEVAGSAR
jgi:integrase